eukprot:TRINITY_DN16927_c0_g1_i2.p1 TRINITY_DN16927_c0_g1~~TRINITY_DN16927_c0_g1_i2.p1  ORF type:complete len:308 (+),score=36.64 TRINITY_DN16927_c0_g1_i2:259-1182(+)
MCLLFAGLLSLLHQWAAKQIAPQLVAHPCQPSPLQAALFVTAANLVVCYLPNLPVGVTATGPASSVLSASALPSGLSVAVAVLTSAAFAVAYPAPCTAAFLALAGGAVVCAMVLCIFSAMVAMRFGSQISGVYQHIENITDEYEELMDTEEAGGLQLRYLPFFYALTTRYVCAILVLATLAAPALLITFGSYRVSAQCLYLSPIQLPFLCCSALWSAAATGQMRLALRTPHDTPLAVGLATTLVMLGWILPSSSGACSGPLTRTVQASAAFAAALAAWLFLWVVSALFRLRRELRVQTRRKAAATAH